MQDIYNVNIKDISGEKDKIIADKFLEKSYFQKIKTERSVLHDLLIILKIMILRKLFLFGV